VPLRERKLIARIQRLSEARAAHAPSPVLLRGIGDDCAVLRPPRGHDLLVTTDFSLEDSHFRRQWHPAESVGHRCLARGLSDIAAMGGHPLASFLSLALPVDLPQRWADGFVKGLLRLARRYHVPLAGGDVSSAALIAADIIVLGSVPRGRALLRSGASPGDAIYVTGALGASAAAIRYLQTVRPGSSTREPRVGDQGHKFPAHFFPEPRIAAGRVLRECRLASACIDLSDGLSTDLSHICEESGVGAVVYAASVPVAKGATLELALHGGEDYELLFTSAARVPREVAGVRVTRIGEIVPARGRACHMWLADERGRQTRLRPRGWEHFAGR
jgi:thiamine-monophosphate kinase